MDVCYGYGVGIRPHAQGSGKYPSEPSESRFQPETCPKLAGAVGLTRPNRPRLKMPLDIATLRFVKRTPGHIVAQCPACAESGADTHGREHLIVWPDGRFGCVANPGDKLHRKRIFELAGDRRPRTPLVATSVSTLLRMPRLSR